MLRIVSWALGVACLLCMSANSRAQCPTLAPAFTVDGAVGGVSDVLVFDDGTGPMLYAAGGVTAAGEIAAHGVVRWDGARWEAVGALLGPSQPPVAALAVFDDGSGAKLYAAGSFTTAGGSAADHVARWNGSSWGAVGAGPGTEVFSLRVLDLGQGPRLVAGVYAWGGPPLRIWNGSNWTAGIGGLFAGRIVGVEMFNGLLYVAAEAYNGVYVYNSGTWFGMGPPLSGTARSLVRLVDGTGPRLYCGTDGGLYAWNDAYWSSLGTPSAMSILRAALLDTGTGTRMHVFGYGFQGGQTSESVMRWSGSGWSPVGASAPSNAVASAFALYDDGSGSALYVGGSFAALQGDTAQGIARWDGQHWRRLATARGIRGPSTDCVRSFASYAPPGAPRPWSVVGGRFIIAGELDVTNVAAWDGARWHALGSGVGTAADTVAALAVYDEPGAAPPALYASGDFLQAGGVGAAYLARWNGSAWSKVGTAALGGLGGVGRALVVHDDGSGAGPCLYAGGSFNVVNGNLAAQNVARWNGSAWQPVGVGLDSGVWAFALYDDPQIAGPAQLYAVGQFGASGPTPMPRVARWDGAAWQPVGAFPSSVTQTHAVAWSDGAGAGGELYVGGLADGSVRRWDGSAWSAIPSYGVPLAGFDDGNGSRLYTTAGRWDGSQLSSFPGLSQCVAAALDEGHGTQSLWFASSDNIGGTACIGVGRYTNPCDVLHAYCTAKGNSLGCVPVLQWSGAPSAAGTQPFTISASQLLNQASGVFFYGVGGRGAAPFYGGTLCVKQPLVRTGLQATSGSPTGVDCTGSIALDFNAWIQTGLDPNLFAGARVDGQFWSRDPQGASTVALSAGIEFEIGP